MRNCWKICLLVMVMMLNHGAIADDAPSPAKKLLVMAFQLNDLTDLSYPPEEIARIKLLSDTFHQRLEALGFELVPMSDALKAEVERNAPTYFYSRPKLAAAMAKDSGADYVVIGVALKPTYLFVYPRLVIVDVHTQEVLHSLNAQLESSWSDPNTTMNTADNLAKRVKARLTARP